MLKARIKADYKRQNLVLLGGISFSKGSWTLIPLAKEEDARKNHSEYLEFSTKAPSEEPAAEPDTAKATNSKGELMTSESDVMEEKSASRRPHSRKKVEPEEPE